MNQPNPFAGSPQLAGMYDQNLGAAVQQAAIQQKDRSNFADLISTSLVQANTARIQKQNRQNQMAMVNERQTRMDERASKMAEIEFTNKVKFEQEKYKQDLSNLDKQLDFEAKLKEKYDDPEAMLQAKFNHLSDRYKIAGDERALQEIMDTFGAQTSEEAQWMARGLIKPNFQAPGAESYRKTAELNRKKKTADVDKTVAEGRKASNEADLIGVQVEVNNFVNEELDKLSGEALDEPEAVYIRGIKEARRVDMASEVSRKKYDEDRAAINLDGARTVQTVTKEMKNLDRLYTKAYKTGTKINFTKFFRAVEDTLLDKDSVQVQQLMAALTEENLVLEGGTMSEVERKKLATEVLTSVQTLVSRANLLGRTVLGQTGTQTDRDFVSNMSAMLTMGHDMNTQRLEMEKGAATLKSNLFHKASLTGATVVARQTLKDIHDSGYNFDERGDLRDIAGNQARILNMFESEEDMQKYAQSRELGRGLDPLMQSFTSDTQVPPMIVNPANMTLPGGGY